MDAPGDRRLLRDSWLWGALLAGLVLRVAPFAFWRNGACTRDECTYRNLAHAIVEGRGLTAPEGWLWAPGWPYLLAAAEFATGTVQTIRPVQLVAGLASIALLYAIAARVFDRRTARLAAWGYALHPTLAYFSLTLWSEVFYGFLLLGAVLGLLWSREGPWWRALLPGVLVGVCVLFRGVATYMAPIFALAAIWPDAGVVALDAARARWRHAAAVLLAVALTVGPYTLHASRVHGGFMLSDATLGQMMWLGNNDFPPVTFDWGNGLLQARAYNPTKRTGRPHCSSALAPAAWDRCERDAGIAWIRSHPREFVERVPIRVAQLVNPHTFLTRHVRWGKWPGLPFALKEGLVLWVVATSFLVVLGGTIAGLLRGKGPFAVLAGGIVAYHVLAIAMLAGLSRYRLPLEPFGIVFVAAVVADPPAALALARAQPWRVAAAVLSALALFPLLLWFLPAGFPGPWT